jgi:hypothetical protein
VKRILGHMEAGGRLRGSAEVPFKSGEHVKVVDGPFTDFTGVVDEVNPERQKVKVMVSIFGRATPSSWTSFRYSRSSDRMNRGGRVARPRATTRTWERGDPRERKEQAWRSRNRYRRS